MSEIHPNRIRQAALVGLRYAPALEALGSYSTPSWNAVRSVPSEALDSCSGEEATRHADRRVGVALKTRRSDAAEDPWRASILPCQPVCSIAIGSSRSHSWTSSPVAEGRPLPRPAWNR